MKTRIIITLLLAISAQLAFAWGSVGHRAIAEIAYKNLDKETKEEIIKILDSDYLPLWANWADEIRADEGEYKKLGELPHYVNMKSDETFEIVKGKSYTIYEAYNEQLATLADKTKNKEDRAIALKLLIHFIGDMHQPMHCARPDDRGGNLIDVTWFGRKTNLHKVWDSALINFTALSYTELAKFSEYYSIAADNTIKSTDPAIWLNESKEIADIIYKTIGNGVFSYSYPYEYLETVYTQIEKAGIRMAEVFNEILK